MNGVMTVGWFVVSIVVIFHDVSTHRRLLDAERALADERAAAKGLMDADAALRTSSEGLIHRTDELLAAHARLQAAHDSLKQWCRGSR